ncbi:MAG: STAS domain-containing protein [Burkholderiaceae bacterium]
MTSVSTESASTRGSASVTGFESLTLAEVNDFLAAAEADTGSAAADLQVIDLSALQRVDSSALAALLHITRNRPSGCRFVNPPPSLQNLARLYGVDDLLFGVGTDAQSPTSGRAA